MNKKPKVIYYYLMHSGKKKRLRHTVKSSCLINRESPNLTKGYWRCRDGHHDIFGFDTVAEVILAEINDTKVRMSEDTEWLKYLEKRN